MLWRSLNLGTHGAAVQAQSELLDRAVSMKVRNRWPSDTATLWSMVTLLAHGHGALSDLDTLR